MHTFIIMNEGHTLFPQQISEIDRKGLYNLKTISVPERGWTIEDMDELIKNIVNKSYHQDITIIIVSPIPYLVGKLSIQSWNRKYLKVYIFHNDKRVAREVVSPSGEKKVIHTVSPDGWQLVSI